MRAATERTTAAGAVLGPDETVPPAGPRPLPGRPDDPGGRPRRIGSGEPADLCLLDVPLAEALTDLTADHVIATWQPATASPDRLIALPSVSGR